jgi:hypothetical protein
MMLLSGSYGFKKTDLIFAYLIIETIATVY